MDITTERLIIRPLAESDAEDIFAYASDARVMESAGRKAFDSLAETRETVREWVEEEERYALVLRETGRVIGHIAVEPDSEEEREDTRELGFMLLPAYQHQGLMTEAVRAVVPALFARGIEYVWACCFRDNPASKRLIEKCGFVLQQEGEYYSESLDRDFDTYEYRISKSGE